MSCRVVRKVAAMLRDASVRDIGLVACAAMTASMAHADTSPDADSDGRTLEEVIEMGRDGARPSTEVKREYFETQVVGVAPLAVLKDIPGVNVQTSDPFALYEGNNRLRIRGFDISQIGQTIDGIPFVNGHE